MSDNEGITPEYLRNTGAKPPATAQDDELRRQIVDTLLTDHNLSIGTFMLDAVMSLLSTAIADAEREAKVDGNTSDGYHTFDELYEFRMLYNAALFNEWRGRESVLGFHVHKSKKHNNGELCFGGGWFIVMAYPNGKQISNHYELKYWDLFRIPEQDRADEWDGHTPQDVAKRLSEFLRTQAAKTEGK